MLIARGMSATASASLIYTQPSPHGTGAVAPELPGWPAAGLAASFAACASITKAAARNFYYGLRLTPEPRRSAIFAIYAWMRAADDLADEPGDPVERREQLERFGRHTGQAMAGDLSGLTDYAFWPAFAATVRSYPIDPGCIADMLAGLNEDQQHAGYETREDLERYCYRVGSTVGVTCVAIWGLRQGADAADARERAIARGRGFQMTNILRDIAQDYDEQPRRVYLPRADLAAHGISIGDLRRWAAPERCRRILDEQIERARVFYRRSDGLESLIDPACAPALWGMTRIYAELLELIARDPKRVITGPRVRLSSTQKGWIALSAFVRSGRAGRAGAAAAEPGPERLASGPR